MVKELLLQNSESGKGMSGKKKKIVEPLPICYGIGLSQSEASPYRVKPIAPRR
jgi:hypothetical protein